jgi:hypothetical protein
MVARGQFMKLGGAIFGHRGGVILGVFRPFGERD